MCHQKYFFINWVRLLILVGQVNYESFSSLSGLTCLRWLLASDLTDGTLPQKKEEISLSHKPFGGSILAESVRSFLDSLLLRGARLLMILENWHNTCLRMYI
jgi:hypothetical protein